MRRARRVAARLNLHLERLYRDLVHLDQRPTRVDRGGSRVHQGAADLHRCAARLHPFLARLDECAAHLHQVLARLDIYDRRENRHEGCENHDEGELHRDVACHDYHVFDLH